MFSPLLQSIIERHGYVVIDHDGLEEFAVSHQYIALFFAGDAERVAESNDVAVVLPELEKAFHGAFMPAVVARDSERALQRKFRFNTYPALVFLKRGGYLGAILKIQDWHDYLSQIQEILTSTPVEPPSFTFPEGCDVAQPLSAPETR